MLAHSIRLGFIRFFRVRVAIFTGSCDIAPLASKASVAVQRSKAAHGSAAMPSYAALARSLKYLRAVDGE